LQVRLSAGHVAFIDVWQRRADDSSYLVPIVKLLDLSKDELRPGHSREASLLEVLRDWPDVDATELVSQAGLGAGPQVGWIMESGELTGSGPRQIEHLFV
jgi:hypothetical protein